jgi:fatty acid desaturase
MQHQIPRSTNLALAAVFFLTSLFQYFILPLVLLPRSPCWGLLLIVFAGLTPLFWALLHEAVHGVLCAKSRLNDLMGRGLFILFGSPFYFLRFGHLAHHRYNRSPVDLDDVYDPAQRRWVAAAAGYYFKLLGGTYLQELAVPLLFLLPRKVTRQALNTFMPASEASFARVKKQAAEMLIDNAAANTALRTDTLLIYALFGLAFLSYGRWWWMLASALLLRGLLVSFLDNVYHYGTRAGDTRYALYLKTPSWLQRLMLNFNLHYMHHRHPAVPWNRLPRLVAKDGREPDMGYFKAVLRQLRGPVPIERIGSA